MTWTIKSTAVVAAAALCGSILLPAEALAQRRRSGRVVRAAPVVRYPHYYSPRYYVPRYYASGYYHPGFYGGFYNPYWFGYGAQYGRYPRYWRPDTTGAARLKVTPRDAQVYVDGFFVGVVDDFDGYLQRLHVAAGEHELQIHRDGHRPFTQKVLFTRGHTLELEHALAPLGPGEAASPLPEPDESRRPSPAGQPSPGRGAAERSTRSEFGSLLLRVQPADAEILIDGEAWTAPEGERQFVIELSAGSHHVEIRKDGMRTYTTTVRVRRGDSVRLNVSLTSGGDVSGG